MDNIIEIKGVRFSYPAEGPEAEPREAIRGVDLSIKRGEFVAILGHNGSGKSTLAKLVDAILLPTEGKITVNGIDSADEDKLFELRQSAGMVFQNPDNQIVSSIVEEDVAFALENLGVPYEEMRRRVDEALKAVDMYEYRLHSPSQLSGGQKQRVAIAGVVAMEPECIILDEPTAMLDPKGRKEVLDVVRKMNREKGVTILLVTHYMDEAALADRIVVMDKGTVALDGSPKEIFPRVAELRALGLDAPQTCVLAYELAEAGYDVPRDVLSVEECAEAILRLFRADDISNDKGA